MCFWRTILSVACCGLFVLAITDGVKAQDDQDAAVACGEVPGPDDERGCLETVVPYEEWNLPIAEPGPEEEDPGERHPWLRVWADILAYKCVEGTNPGDPCETHADCDGGRCEPDEPGELWTCVGGGNPGASCATDADCEGGLCEVTTETEEATVCVGGDNDGNTCQTHADCPGDCVGGVHDGASCLTDVDCAGACVGGTHAGAACVGDDDCAGICDGGNFDGEPCLADMDCAGFCIGGESNFEPCQDDGDCPSGGTCEGSGACVGSGTCDGYGTCSGVCGVKACDGGDNDGDPCTTGASCTGGGSCVLWDESYEADEGYVGAWTGEPGCFNDPCEGRGVFPPDNRVRIRRTLGYPWRTIGRLVITWPGGARSSCSGALIGPRHVLTAGHCVHTGGAGGRWARRVTFSPGQDGWWRPFGTQRAVRIYSFTGWTRWRSRNHDMALLVLNSRIGRVTGWLGYQVGPDLWTNRNLSGYPGDKPRGTQWYDWDPVINVTRFLMRYRIDTFGGQSGSPVWRYYSHRRYVKADHTRFLGWANEGVRITSGKFRWLRRWIRANPRRAVQDPCVELGCDGVNYVPDCNRNGIPDDCDVTCDSPCDVIPGCGLSSDSNQDGIPDECGACCGPGPCVQVTEAECEISEWSYRGDATTCEEEACDYIPTVSEWGLVVMLLLLVAAGTIVIRRRGTVAV